MSRITLTLGESVVKGELVRDWNGSWDVKPEGTSSELRVWKLDGWVATVEPELPAALGSIIRWTEDHIAGIAEREAPNQWLCNWDADDHTDADVVARIAGRPFVVLAPVQDVIDTLRSMGRDKASNDAWADDLAAHYGLEYT